MIDLPAIAYVTERDIDLLILEEVIASSRFAQWLIQHVWGQEVGEVKLVKAAHSVSDVFLGESDIVVIFTDTAHENRAILIENKVKAAIQPRQAERYHERGRLGIQNGHWKDFRTLMSAPRSYLRSCAEASTYDQMLSYEDILAWFEAGTPTDSRSSYKADLIRAAIDHSRRIGERVLDARVTQFWASYWQQAKATFPELEMKEPGARGPASDWIEFRPRTMRKGFVIVHKLESGFVDLQLDGAGSQLELLGKLNPLLMRDGFKLVKTGKSASLRITVPPIDRFESFDDQLDDVHVGIKAAYRLLSVSPFIQLGT